MILGRSATKCTQCQRPLEIHRKNQNWMEMEMVTDAGAESTIVEGSLLKRTR